MKHILFLILILSSVPVLAEDHHEWTTESGLEIDELITLGSSILATVLFVLTSIAYKRDGRKKLLFVSIAFLLFAIKGFMMASELVISDMVWIDPVANILDFAILLSFFLGIVKK